MEGNQITVVVALVRNDEGNILLQRRIDPIFPRANGKWEFPGGKIHFGETLEEAVIRECKEETDCTVSIDALLPRIQTNVWERQDGTKLHVVVICFLTKYIAGDPKPLDKKVSEVRWCTKEEIKTLHLLDGILEFVDLESESH